MIAFVELWPRAASLEEIADAFQGMERRAVNGIDRRLIFGRLSARDEIASLLVKTLMFNCEGNTDQAYADRGLNDNSPERIKDSTHAVFYALDAQTGKELYSSGNQIKSFVHFGGLSVANGRVYLGTYDSTLYCFGLPGK